MTDRDRLAADLHAAICDYHWPDLLTCGIDHADDADRLIALGWVHKDSKDLTVDEERLARALEAALPCEDPEEPCDADGREDHRWCDYCIARSVAAVRLPAIAKAYREDTDATD